MDTDLKIYEEVESTNITLSELADKGADEGTCVVAFYQSAGQGRSGRTFFSPKGGNLYMSLLLRPKDSSIFDMITTMASVAVCDSISEIFDIEAGIKWVNDIMLRGKKVCGIIATAHNFGRDDMYVILGIGINLYDAPEIPDDIKDIYGSVTGISCDLSEERQREQALVLAKTIADRFSYHYGSNNIYEHMDEYRRRSVVIGKKVDYISGDRMLSATCTGIDDRGGIILEDHGEKRVYRDGEIRIRPAGMQSCVNTGESL